MLSSYSKARIRTIANQHGKSYEELLESVEMRIEILPSFPMPAEIEKIALAFCIPKVRQHNKLDENSIHPRTEYLNKVQKRHRTMKDFERHIYDNRSREMSE